MPVTLDQGGEVCAIRLEGEINIAVASGLKTALIEALASGKDLRLELGQPVALDITALQLLWAAEREARASGKEFTVKGAIPEDVLLTVVEAGLEKFPLAVGPK